MALISSATNPSSPFALVKSDHAGLRVANLETAMAWYRDKLDFRHTGGTKYGANEYAFLAPANDDSFQIELVAGPGATELDPAHLTSNAVQQYQEAVKTSLASYAGSTQILNRSADNRRAYEGMINNIETAPDLKAASDLNNRLAAQNGLTMNQLVQVMAMQANMQAQGKLELAAGEANQARTLQLAPLNGGYFTYDRAAFLAANGG